MAEMNLKFGKIDLRSWRVFDAADGPAKERDRIIATETTEVLQAMFKNYPPLLEFVPFEYPIPPGAAHPPLMLPRLPSRSGNPAITAWNIAARLNLSSMS